MQKSAISNSTRPVINLTTGERYINSNKASLAYNKHPNAVYVCINSDCLFCGQVFEYEDQLTSDDLVYEFNIRKQKIIKKKLSHKTHRLVTNLTTGQVYSSIHYANICYGGHNVCSLRKAIDRGNKWKECYWCFIDQLDNNWRENLDWNSLIVQQLK